MGRRLPTISPIVNRNLSESKFYHKRRAAGRRYAPSEMAVGAARKREPLARRVEETGALPVADAADLGCGKARRRRRGAEGGDLVGRHGAHGLVVMTAGA